MPDMGLEPVALWAGAIVILAVLLHVGLSVAFSGSVHF